MSLIPPLDQLGFVHPDQLGIVLGSERYGDVRTALRTDDLNISAADTV